MPQLRGHLIVLEGLDRSGKSTQTERLVKHLQSQNRKVEHLRFPNRTTPIGQMINSYLNGSTQQEDHAIHLIFSANRWELADYIKSLIASGTTVVIDRYYYSGCVYSAAKQNPTMDLEWCRHMEVGLPRPDLCVFLDLEPGIAEQRGGYGGERYEKKEMQERVRGLFKAMREHRDEGEDTVVVDAGKSVDEVEGEIREVVRGRFEGREVGALRVIRPW